MYFAELGPKDEKSKGFQDEPLKYSRQALEGKKKGRD